MSLGRSPAPTSVELLEIALDAARAAAELVRGYAVAGARVSATKSSEVDPVTEADRASEELIRRQIGGRRPHDAFLGEEGDDVDGTSGVRWIVDPIDGTVNFLYAIPQYAVSIAAEVSTGSGADACREVVAGVVLNVATGTEYTAAHEPVPGADGPLVVVARRDGEPIGVRPAAPLGHRLIGTGFSYDAELRGWQALALSRMVGRVRDIRRLGSCSLDLCAVAEGSLDGYFEEGVNLWDYAAGALVAQAAGARVEVSLGMAGRTFVLCAPEHGFDELHMVVAEAGYLAAEPGRNDDRRPGE